MKVLFFGDIVGRTGRSAVAETLPKLREQYRPDLVMANVENAAHGKGVTVNIISELKSAGIDFFTSGNHVFDKRDEAEKVFSQFSGEVVRPANFSGNLPGKGFRKVSAGRTELQVINLNGQVFMEKQFELGVIENPFFALDRILSDMGERGRISFLDFHSEATSEKRAMGLYADGKVSVIIGTHTHVQTNDAQILPNGSGYLSDVGMVGAANSVIGVQAGGVLSRFFSDGSLGGASLKVDEGTEYELGFCFFEIDETNGRCQNIVAKILRGKLNGNIETKPPD